jgi:methionyl-tRNA formyltransferase
MAPSFHALLNGESKVGATLHVVTKGFDTGDILAQIDVAITKSDSVYSLNRKTSRRGGKLLASFLESFDPETVVATPQPEGSGKYYTYPTPAEVMAFRNRHLLFVSNCDDEADCGKG